MRSQDNSQTISDTAPVDHPGEMQQYSSNGLVADECKNSLHQLSTLWIGAEPMFLMGHLQTWKANSPKLVCMEPLQNRSVATTIELQNYLRHRLEGLSRQRTAQLCALDEGSTPGRTT